VARERYAKHKPNWAASRADKIILRLEKDVFPWLGSKPIAEITALDVLTCLRRIEGRGALDTAHRVHQNCGQVLRYAVATGRAMRDPSLSREAPRLCRGPSRSLTCTGVRPRNFQS